ncbi:MAG: hypothetical protein GY839_18745 [candidate division Zixibacteria bacterium]|nr:hypothetical protein [candidate division Zixibacteria bacterium]
MKRLFSGATIIHPDTHFNPLNILAIQAQASPIASVDSLKGIPKVIRTGDREHKQVMEMIESLVIQLDYLGFIIYKRMQAMYRGRANNAG